MTRRVLRFDPHCEAGVARGTPHHTPRREAAAIGEDLAAVMVLLAGLGDVVWLDRAPSEAWLDQLRAAGFAVPDIATGRRPPPGRPAPWGWSPDVARRFGQRWDPRLGLLFPKQRWLPTLEALVRAGAPGLCGPEDVGVACLDEASVLAAVAACAGPVVAVKAPLGTSGRGAKRVQGGELTASTRGWIRRVLAEQGAVIVEPWRERLVDLSALLDVGPGGARLLGVTRFDTDARGQYLGARLGDPAADQEVAPWLPALGWAAERVGAELLAAGHRGLAGVDAMVFAHPDGGRRLKPLLEVNPRATMGHVTLALRARAAPGVGGRWRLRGRRELPGLGSDGFAALAARVSARHPLRLSPGGRVLEGAVFTNDPAAATAILGVATYGPAAPGGAPPGPDAAPSRGANGAVQPVQLDRDGAPPG